MENKSASQEMEGVAQHIEEIRKRHLGFALGYRAGYFSVEITIATSPHREGEVLAVDGFGAESLDQLHQEFQKWLTAQEDVWWQPG